ncbi:MAG: phosphate propanoyltransferase [Synergistaceae bacterium]|jgi:putative phosphotransacetylase|nr:phosphate propanoyltransferase [Synergistaceae bacterium]
MIEGRAELETEIRNAVLTAIYKKNGVRYVPVAISNRHAHLSRADIDVLFGAGYSLTPIKPLSQPGQYAAKETVSLIGSKGRIDCIRILGPERKSSQVEISVTDSFRLGVEPIPRMSGETSGSAGARIETKLGYVDLSEGVIVAARHMHISSRQALEMGLSDGQTVSLKSGGRRGVVFDNVIVRSGDCFDLEAHIDTDEANAALLRNGDILEVVLA